MKFTYLTGAIVFFSMLLAVSIGALAFQLVEAEPLQTTSVINVEIFDSISIKGFVRP